MKVPESYKMDIISNIENLGLDNVWNLRENVQVLKNFVLKNSKLDNGIVLDNIDEFLDASGEFYKYLSGLQNYVSAADFNKLARLLNTGGDALSAIEEIMSGEDINLTEIVMSGLTMMLGYVGSTAYISSALESSETQIMAYSITIHDRLWNLVHKYNSKASIEELEKIKQNISLFFKQLLNKNVKISERIVIITRLYQLLCMIYLAGILKNVQWVK